jgi:hypothetical protein
VAVADAAYSFISTEVGAHGSLSDSNVFKNCIWKITKEK